jgi:hypothetical protein
MKYGKMIVKWNGLLPVVDDIPKNEIIWDVIGLFMDRVRCMGAVNKPEMKI